MWLDEDSDHSQSQDESSGSDEPVKQPEAESRPIEESAPTKKRSFPWPDFIRKTRDDESSGFRIDIDIDVKRIKGVFYNTVRPIHRPKGRDSSEFERGIVHRDPTRYLPPSVKNLYWILKRDIRVFKKKQKLIWAAARFEAICNKLSEEGDTLSRIRAGVASISKQQLFKLFSDDWKKLYGGDGNFPIGEPELGILPYSNFMKREDLVYFGICQEPYETVSVTTLKDGTKIAQAIILDGSPSMGTDMGLRFIFYSPFERTGVDPDSIEKNQAIFQAWIQEIPIRVVRAYNAASRYAPIWGYRYDGVYRIIAAFSDNNKQGVRVWTYVFSACDPSLEPPVFVGDEMDLTLQSILDNELRASLSKNVHVHARIQKTIKKKLTEDLRYVDVVYNGRKLFTIAVPYLIRKPGGGEKNIPLLVNFVLIYNYIRRVCIVKDVGRQWLDGPAEEYENARKSGSKIWWARGGFLPMRLMIRHCEPSRRLTMEIFKGQYKEKVLKRKRASYRSLPINREMAKCVARPFFPQSDTDSIYTYIELGEPMPSTWNPYEDISAGEEVHPIPVVNEVDNEEPPMVFTYITKNVFLSRLPPLNFDPVCAGCVPETLEKYDCEAVVVRGFCKGLLDRKGRLFCHGVNKSYLTTIQSRAACSDNCPCSVFCNNRLMEGVQIPVQLVKTTNMGWALHSMVSIAAGTYIMQYVGEIICRKEMIAREHQYDKLGRFNYCMEAVEMETLHDDWQMPCMDSMVLGNIARFLNHSCDPNVEVITVWRGEDFPCIAVYALRDIEAEEALTYCYGPQYKNIPCLCNASNCKGFIGNI